MGCIDKFRFSDDASGFVNIADEIPDVTLEIRYYSLFNFIGERIRGYEEPLALLSREACAALKKADADFRGQGYGLKIYDAYRPQSAVDHFVQWAEDLGDTRMKASFYPDVDKKDLFAKGYIAARSGHSRGSTVDLTLIDLKTGEDVDMGGSFDWFGELSHPSFRKITDEQYRNRMFLRDGMMKHGFVPIEEEWWHFTLKDEPYPDTYFTFPVAKRSIGEKEH